MITQVEPARGETSSAPTTQISSPALKLAWTALP